MRLFFINTDAVSYGGVSQHDEWLRRDVVVTGGEARYKTALARIPKGARVLVYVNGLGVVFVGETTTGEVLDVTKPDTVNPSEPIEYHRPVSWLLDLRTGPITRNELIDLLGQGPLQAVQEVQKGMDVLLHRLAVLEAVPTSDTGTYLRIASELYRYGRVERPEGTLNPRRTSYQGTQYSRDPWVRAWALQRAQGRCELCEQPAPFVDECHTPYLESHHIVRLCEGGADTPQNTAALCANCHRELHFGAESRTKTEKLRTLITVKEAGMHVAPPVAAG